MLAHVASAVGSRGWKPRAATKRSLHTSKRLAAEHQKPKLTSAKHSALATTVEVKFESQKYHLDSFWLRDNDPATVHPSTYQRLSPTALIPLNIQPKNVGLENGNLVIEWPDQVKSTYPSDWLYTHIHREQNDIHPPNSHNTVLWSGKTWSTSEAIPVRVDFNALESNDEVVAKQALKGLLTDIYKYGFALVENTPATAEATRAVAQKIGLLRMTIFGGDSWDYVIESHKETLLHSDTAYTPLDIKPHTDATFNWDPAGLQFFHCLEHVGEGGVNGLVDGWNVLTQLQQTNPDVYKYLTTEPLDFYYSDKKYAFHSHTPVARVNAAGAITAFKFNNHDRNPPHPLRTDLALYHKAVQTLEQAIENKDNSVAIKLLPGTVLITYGWRVLHSRTPFTGRRRMVGCYVGGDDFMSKYRVTSRTSDSDIQIH